MAFGERKEREEERKREHDSSWCEVFGIRY